MKSRAVPPRTEVSVRAEKVRRTDLLACAAMLLSVLCAQAAMWSARGGAMYPAAMVFSAIAGLLATLDAGSRSAAIGILGAIAGYVFGKSDRTAAQSKESVSKPI